VKNSSHLKNGFFTKPIVQKVFAKIKNKYIIATVLFLFWIIFIDGRNLIDRYFAIQKYKELNQTKQYYQEKIKKDQAELLDLKNNKSLEKLAREKYLMKKPNEDIYIIQEEK